jgi:hypothetical protein
MPTNFFFSSGPIASTPSPVGNRDKDGKSRRSGGVRTAHCRAGVRWVERLAPSASSTEVDQLRFIIMRPINSFEGDRQQARGELPASGHSPCWIHERTTCTQSPFSAEAVWNIDGSADPAQEPRVSTCGRHQDPGGTYASPRRSPVCATSSWISRPPGVEKGLPVGARGPILIKLLLLKHVSPRHGTPIEPCPADDYVMS